MKDVIEWTFNHWLNWILMMVTLFIAYVVILSGIKEIIRYIMETFFAFLTAFQSLLKDNKKNQENEND